MPEHVHKYKRIKMGPKYVVYRCVMPDCPHYVRPELVIGRACICWDCRGVFFMNIRSATKIKPKCKRCVEKRRLALSSNKDEKGKFIKKEE